MKKTIAALLLTLTLLASSSNAWAENTAKHGEITGKTVCSGLLSFFVWPGIGQYVNDQQTKKNVTHAILGITGIFRFWSGWDALVDRNGGRWDGKI